jgi:hypothetical protein
MILLFLNYFREKMENKIGILTQIAEKNWRNLCFKKTTQLIA